MGCIRLCKGNRDFVYIVSEYEKYEKINDVLLNLL